MSDYSFRGLVQLGAEELARRLLIMERVRKHWRIIATKAALHQIGLPAVTDVCVREIMGIVPEEEELDEELHRLITEVEARKGCTDDWTKEFRSIMLGDDDEKAADTG